MEGKIYVYLNISDPASQVVSERDKHGGGQRDCGKLMLLAGSYLVWEGSLNGDLKGVTTRPLGIYFFVFK